MTFFDHANWALGELIYFFIATISTTLFLLKLAIFSFADINSDSDISSDSDDGGFTFFSLQSLLAFFMGFGWIGLAGRTEWQCGSICSFMLAFAAGSSCLFLSVLLMFVVKKLNYTPKRDLSELIGESVSSYVQIAPHATGRILVNFCGKSTIIPAINDSDDHIKAFETVTIVDVKRDTIYVRRNI
ncbi:MAG: hypothetical protein LBD36_01660 [Holosporales bacterium]|jgi:hypothetical protein|nr:hypothetical protein [Holosporales bacterium]